MKRPDHARQELTPRSGRLGPVTENAVENPLERRPLHETHLQLLVLIVAVVLASVVVLWLLLRGEGKTTFPTANGRPTLVSQAQLERFADSVDHPVYWAGPRDGFSYELTVTAGRRIFVRYLPHEVKAGDRRPDFLVVGTYPGGASFDGLKRAAKQEDSVSVEIDKGGLVVFNSKKPTSVYFSYPGAKYQVEVFSPSGNTARTLVLAGQIRPIE